MICSFLDDDLSEHFAPKFLSKQTNKQTQILPLILETATSNVNMIALFFSKNNLRV